MQEAVYRVLTLVSALVVDVPIGTNLGLLHLFWMLLSGKALLTRGAIIPGLSAVVLSEGAVLRAWAALGRGSWTSDRLVTSWARVVEAEGFWQPHQHGGYHPVAVDITAFWRPRLQGCPTRHYSATAGKALPGDPAGDHRPGWQRGGAAVRAAAGAGAGGPEGAEPERAPAGAAGAGGGAAGADRYPGAGSGVHRRAARGGGGNGLGDPVC